MSSNFYFLNHINNSNYPRGITNSNNGEFSYANGVLLFLRIPSLITYLQQFAQFFKVDNQNSRYRLLKAINELYSSDNPDSKNVIKVLNDLYEENRAKLNSINPLPQDPYNFLFFLLQFLHLEVNFSPRTANPKLLNQLTIEQKRDESKVTNIFSEYIKLNHKDSIIFDYFYHTEKNLYSCQRCGTYYDCELISIFKMNLSTILAWRNLYHNNKAGIMLNLDDCFNYYCQGKRKVCQCNNDMSVAKKIYNGRYIIISFKRDANGNNRDIDFPIKFDFSNYANNVNGRNRYTLYSCISYMPYNNNQGSYITYMNYNLNNDYGNWVKYMNNFVKELNSCNDIYEYQPHMLIYSADIDNANQKGNISQNMNNSSDMNNQSFSDFNLINLDNNLNNGNYNNNNINLSNQQNNFMNANNFNGNNNNNNFNNGNNGNINNSFNNANNFNGNNNNNNNANANNNRFQNNSFNYNSFLSNQRNQI